MACHACAAREAAGKKFHDVDGVKLAVHLLPDARDLLIGGDDG